jgi:hypothetical protein
MRPSSTVVAAAVMAAIFFADPGVLVERHFNPYTHYSLLCSYATFQGTRHFASSRSPGDSECDPLIFGRQRRY